MARPLPFAGRPLLTRLRLLVLLLLLLRDVLQFFNHIGRDTFPPALFSKRFQIATLSPAATADSRTGLLFGCPRTLQDGVTASRRKAALGILCFHFEMCNNLQMVTHLSDGRLHQCANVLHTSNAF